MHIYKWLCIIVVSDKQSINLLKQSHERTEWTGTDWVRNREDDEERTNAILERISELLERKEKLKK